MTSISTDDSSQVFMVYDQYQNSTNCPPVKVRLYENKTDQTFTFIKQHILMNKTSGFTGFVFKTNFPFIETYFKSTHIQV